MTDNASFRELLAAYEQDRAEARDTLYGANRSPKGFFHVEAFCLMDYRCRSCGTIETLWNSRDGVTPFAIQCKNSDCNLYPEAFGCPMHHNNWKADRYAPDYLPTKGTRVFMDMPVDRARLLARIRVARSLEREQLTPERAAEVAEAVFQDLWHDGFGPHVTTI